MRRVPWIALALASCVLLLWLQRAPSPDSTGTSRVPGAAHDVRRSDAPAIGSGRDALPGFLPREAQTTLRRIADGGPFPHARDGSIFQNRERRLPPRPRGWYREYTVATPGARDRGARRIVSGGTPPREFWYTDDHYRSFRRFDWAPETTR